MRARSHFCSRLCSGRAQRLLSEYLADGRFAQVLAPELAEIKAAHRAKVAGEAVEGGNISQRKRCPACSGNVRRLEGAVVPRGRAV